MADFQTAPVVGTATVGTSQPRPSQQARRYDGRAGYLRRTNYPNPTVARKATAAAVATKQSGLSEDSGQQRDSEDEQLANSNSKGRQAMVEAGKQTKDSEGTQRRERQIEYYLGGYYKGRDRRGLINTMNLQVNELVSKRPGWVRNCESRTCSRSQSNSTSHAIQEEIIRMISTSISGLADIMYEMKKLPQGFFKSTIYQLGLFVYFFLNFIYSVFIACTARGWLAFHFVYMSTSLIGFIFEFNVMITTISKCLMRSCKKCNVEDDNRGKTQRGDEQVRDYRHKGKSVLVDYVISSLGEFLIYPTLICVMYGFINERSWQFDNEVSTYNLVLLVYSMIMDALYMKFYVIFLMIRILRASDAIAKCAEVTSNYPKTLGGFSVYLILLAITTALTHWLMTAIIGVRIYMTRHEKTGLMCTKYTYSYYGMYLLYCLRF